MPTGLGLIAVLALVLLNGFFVAAEFALVAVRRTRVEELLRRGVQGAKAVDSAVANLDRSIAATQLGITLASIGLGFICEPALVQVVQPLFSALPESWQGAPTHGVSTIAAATSSSVSRLISSRPPCASSPSFPPPPNCSSPSGSATRLPPSRTSATTRRRRASARR